MKPLHGEFSAFDVFNALKLPQITLRDAYLILTEMLRAWRRQTLKISPVNMRAMYIFVIS